MKLNFILIASFVCMSLFAAEQEKKENVLPDDATQANVPVITSIFGKTNVTTNTYLTYKAIFEGASSGLSFDWEIIPRKSNELNGGLPDAEVVFHETGSYEIRVRARSGSQVGDYCSIYVEVN